MNKLSVKEQLFNHLSIYTECIWIQTIEEQYTIADIYSVVNKIAENLSISLSNALILEWDEGNGGNKYYVNNRTKLSEKHSSDIDFDDEDTDAFSLEWVPPSSDTLLKHIADLQNQVSYDNVIQPIIIKGMSDINDPKIVRLIRNLKEGKKKSRDIIRYFPIIMVSSSGDVPSDLQKLFVMLNQPIPSVEEIKKVVSMFIINKNMIPKIEDEIFNIAQAASGLTIEELTRCFNLSYKLKNDLDVGFIVNEKINAIQKSGILTYKQPTVTLDDIGGHAELKSWIEEQKMCMSQEALDYGIVPAKGFLSVGIPGSGKTMAAEAIANYFNIPFVVLDLSKIMGGIVGESERNARAALDVLDSIGRCVILVDEAEKALGGIKSSNRSDGGTMARVFGIILQHMNDNNNQFYVLTSNKVSDLPPELSRSGRLDTKWFFDFPSEEDRKNIFNIYFNKANKDVSENLINIAAKCSALFTGAEIKNAVNNIIKSSFFRCKKNNTEHTIEKEDILYGIAKIVTVNDTSSKDIKELKSYVKLNNIPSTSSSRNKEIFNKIKEMESLIGNLSDGNKEKKIPTVEDLFFNLSK